MNNLIALVAGLLFGAGLMISGMMDTQKVIGFLDLFGDWDPSLMFVMGSALAITIPAFHLLSERGTPFFEPHFHLPLSKSIDKQLIIGAGIFGIGWGIYGYCPGPGISSLSTGNTSSFIFVVCMLVGMFVANQVNKQLAGN